MGLTCWKCGKMTSVKGKPFRNDSCPSCLADLRCCRGCLFYDPHSAHRCRERIDEPVKIKNKANFCDYFTARVVGAKGLDRMNNKESRKKDFDDLFDD
ncbi:MAG: hypothetical protein V3V99_05060 [candidate division Zixibacteria bacterium]